MILNKKFQYFVEEVCRVAFLKLKDKEDKKKTNKTLFYYCI